jgi:hypothetical protein
MIMENKEIYLEIMEKIQSGNMILFLGSGSTRQCLKTDGTPGITGQELANEILTAINHGKNPDLRVSLTQAAEYFISYRPTARIGLDELIQDRLQGLQPTLGHYLMTLFPWKAIITTNYNMVVEEAYQQSLKQNYCKTKLDIVRNDDDLIKRNRSSNIVLYKPHGCISLTGQVQTPLIITSKDYFDSVGLRPKLYKEINSLVKECSTLFIGYSLDDYTFKNIYYGAQNADGTWINKCYCVSPTKDPLYYKWAKNALINDFNTELLNTTFDSLLINLLQLRKDLNIPHPLKIKIKALWENSLKLNGPYMNGINLSDILGED